MANQTIQELDTKPDQKVPGKVLKDAPLDISSPQMFQQAAAPSKIPIRLLLIAIAIGLIVIAPRILGFVHRVYALVVGSN